MDNIFYTHPQHIIGNKLELVDHEAHHAAKVLRFDIGDELFAADGRGNVYQTQIISITKKSLLAEIKNTESVAEPEIKKVLAFGAIKKRDRLEFAVEKAVELGAWEICVFNADHSERSKINEDRLKAIVLSAFKQSKRKWLPEIRVLSSMEDVLDQYPEHNLIMAHVEAEVTSPEPLLNDQNLMLVGPEGGFSERELTLVKKKDAEFISLGQNRLRAETAVMAMLSQYIYES